MTNPPDGERRHCTGSSLRIRTLAQNLSRKSLAKMAGISESTIKRFESNGQITLDALILIATALSATRQIAELFKHEQPVSLEEIKQTGRTRGAPIKSINTCRYCSLPHRSASRTLNREPAMSTTKLRLGPLPKTENVKLAFTCPTSLKADLERYAALHSQTYGEEVDALTLVPYMQEAFMARDRVFRRLGKTS